MAPRDGKHLTFILADEEYAIPVTDVREIVGPLPVTPVPGTAHHVLGVINLRGKVIPVIDLRLRLGLVAGDIGPRSCVVVCQPRGGALVGALVDTVVEVMSVRADDTEPAPAVAGAEVAGLAKIKDRVVIIGPAGPAVVAGPAQPPVRRRRRHPGVGARGPELRLRRRGDRRQPGDRHAGAAAAR